MGSRFLLRWVTSWWSVATLSLFTAFFCRPAFAEDEYQAFADRLYQRLAGVPLTFNNPKRTEILRLLSEGKKLEAAHVITDDDRFYNVTIRHWATPISSREFDVLMPMSDLIAMMIGTTRDDRDFREILTGDYTYVGDPVLAPNLFPDAVDTNGHYQSMDDQMVNLRQILKRVEPQRNAPDDLPEAAGVLTSRQWGQQHLSVGTIRRPIEYAFSQFLCKSLLEIADSTVPEYRIRRDVDRSPGGNTSTFVRTCRGCHAGLDALAGAYAFYDFNFAKLYTYPRVSPRFTKNASVYPQGYNTTDSSWINLWTEGQNAKFGWRGPTEGVGVHELGVMLSNSMAFSSCTVTRTYRHVCRREPTERDAATIQELARKFEQSGYRLRRLFEEVAILPECSGE